MLNKLSSPYGDTEQKVASYFLQDLFSRMIEAGDRTFRTLTLATMVVEDVLVFIFTTIFLEGFCRVKEEGILIVGVFWEKNTWWPTEI